MQRGIFNLHVGCANTQGTSVILSPESQVEQQFAVDRINIPKCLYFITYFHIRLGTWLEKIMLSSYIMAASKENFKIWVMNLLHAK